MSYQPSPEAAEYASPPQDAYKEYIARKRAAEEETLARTRTSFGNQYTTPTQTSRDPSARFPAIVETRTAYREVSSVTGKPFPPPITGIFPWRWFLPVALIELAIIFALMWINTATSGGGWPTETKERIGESVGGTVAFGFWALVFTAVVMGCSTWAKAEREWERSRRTTP